MPDPPDPARILLSSIETSLINSGMVQVVAKSQQEALARVLDQVGWVPWTGLFLAMLVCGTMFVLLGAEALFPA